MWHSDKDLALFDIFLWHLFLRADFPYTCYQIRLVSEREPILCKHLNKTLIQSVKPLNL